MSFIQGKRDDQILKRRNITEDESVSPLREINLQQQVFCMLQGLKLQLTGRQCDQNLGVGDQNFRTGRQQATNLLSPRHLKFQGKSAFLKRKLEALVDNCSKTKRRFYDRHIYVAPYCFSGLIRV